MNTSIVKQDVEDPASRLLRLIERADAELRRQFLQTINQMRRGLDLEDVEQLLLAGRFNEALLTLEARAGIFGSQINSVFVLAGQDTAQFMRNRLGIVVDFDQTNVRAVSQMSQSRLRLIREFSEEQRRATRTALTDGITRGINPRDQARVFRDSIGLTERQQRSVMNFRRLLSENSAEALTRRLRDRRFDSTILQAIRNERPLTGDQIERMVQRYSERFVQFRSQVIARTEALRAVHEGNDEMYQQAFDAGTLNPDQIARTWITARDDRVRDPAHTSMEGQRQPVGEPFISGNGNRLRFPGDPNAPASETVQCRCALSTRIQGEAINEQ